MTYSFSPPQPWLHSGLWCCLCKGSSQCSGGLCWPGWQGSTSDFQDIWLFNFRESFPRLCSIHSILPSVLSCKGFLRLVMTNDQICAHKCIFGQICIFGCSKYGQVGWPWKDLAIISSDALFLGQKDLPVKSYDQIHFLADFPIVITM